MRHTQQARFDSMYGVQDYLGKHSDVLGPVTQAPARAQLNDLVTVLRARVATQHGAAETAANLTKRRDELREELRLHHMRPIAEVARARLAGLPDIVKFRLPAADVKDGRLVAAADAMAERAAAFREVFQREMLGEDFIERLKAATDALRAGITARNSAQNDVVAATEAVDHSLAIGSSIVRVLDSLVIPQLKSRPDLLSAWVSAKRPRAKGGVPQGTVRKTPDGGAPPPATEAPASKAA